MKKIVSSALACAIVGSSLVAGLSPAMADRKNDRERYVSNYCEQHPRDRDCRDFRKGHKNWDERRYQSWYRSHHRDRNDNSAAAIFGFAAGAIAGAAASAAANNSGGHVAACEARYRSYDRRTDTYLDYDGNRYRCTL